MNKRRTVQWICACAVALVLACVISFVRKNGRARLPDLVIYPDRPLQFNRALHAASARAESRGHDSEDVRRLAQLYLANRLYTEARVCYQAIAASKEGSTAHDHYYLAAIALDESDLHLAQKELRFTLQSEPGYVPARLALAEVLFKTGQADAAAKEYASALDIDPGNPRASLGLARIDLQKGNDEAATSRLTALVAHHPESTSGEALLAQILDRKGQTGDADAMRARSQQIHEPVAPDPWMKALMADCYDLQRLELAFEEYRLAAQLDEALPLLGRLDELDPNGWIPPMLRGWSQKEAGHYPEAVQDYTLALRNGGDPEQICPLLGAALLTEHHPAEAATLLAHYHAQLPNSIPILLSYSEVAVNLKDDKLARSLLTQVLKSEPDLYMPNMSMAQILWTSGEQDAAAQCLQRVAKVFPADIDSRGLLGQYYMGKSDPWSAIVPLEQAVDLAEAGSPKRERLTAMLDSAYLLAGSLDASQGNFSDAITFSDRSIRLVPNGLRGYALKANVFRRLKDFKRSAEALGRMVSLKPDDPSIRMGLGDMEYQDGNKDGARQDWQRALHLVPADSNKLRDALERRLAGQISADTFQ
jgi:tetratricopeptide (TPR) repeat protein